jgi:ribosomal protein S18 acetylase RimI-like enzyme
MLYDYNDVIAKFPVYLACVDEQLVGTLVLSQGVDGFCLDVVAVDPRFQGCGIGKQLIQFAESQATASGFDSIYLYTNAMMVENQALYLKLGYIQHDRRVEDGYDRLYFRKRLV